MSDLISRQAAIEAICTQGTSAERDGQYVISLATAKQRAVDILESLPTIDPAKWISVSERLPEEKKQVLVCDAYGFIYTAECEVISDDEWLDWRWYESVEYRPMDDVVAWMPLPEPWKGADNDK